MNCKGRGRKQSLFNLKALSRHLEPCSSVSIVSGYGLDDREIEVRSPAEAKDFSSSLCVQTGSEAHPASCPLGTGGPFLGGKARPGRYADHSHHVIGAIRPSSLRLCVLWVCFTFYQDICLKGLRNVR
jgi:hypothetical protein